jgi:hypothetical protein
VVFLREVTLSYACLTDGYHSVVTERVVVGATARLIHIVMVVEYIWSKKFNLFYGDSCDFVHENSFRHAVYFMNKEN